MTNRTFKIITACAGALCCAGALMAQTNIEQWDFNNGDLSATLGGDPLTYADGSSGATKAGTQFGTTAALGLPPINGTNADVMAFPISGPTMGYDMPVITATGNGGGSLVNDYTIIMDILFPASTLNEVRPLVQTDDGIITPDADLVVDSSGGIGAPPGPYYGNIQPNTWYRIGFSVTESNIEEYINGVNVGQQNPGGVDSRFALTPQGYAVLFQNSTTNGAAPGFVSSIQFRDRALNAGEMAALGGPSSAKIPTNSTLTVLAYVDSQNPTPNEADVTPLPDLEAVLHPGGTTIDSNSIVMALDGKLLTTTVTNNADGSYTLSAQATNLLDPLSAHTASVIYSIGAGLLTNSWSFSVLRYQDVNLPAPYYFENFDEVAEGGIPAGWTVTNHTDVIDPGYNLLDPNSDSYLNWVVVSTETYSNAYPFLDDYVSPGFPEIAGNRRQMIPPIVENGVLLNSLATSNLLVCESDQRSGNQVDVIFTKDYDFTGHTNVYVAFNMLNEQNQDNISSVEYSIDQGQTWLPLMYMLDDGTTDNNGSDVVTNPVTGQIDVFATFETARNDQAWNEPYGDFIGAVISTNLIPAIVPARNDDPVQQKRIVVLRMPMADNQPNVRLRFGYAGTGSWYFDIDDLGFYSIPQPIILDQPSPVDADYNGPAVFTVGAGGNNLTYQWEFNGTNILDATNSTFTIPNTSTNDIGTYSVAVTNSFGGALSVGVPLTLVYTPIILAPPLGETISVGETAQFTVQARGGQPLSYQWLLNSNAIQGATESSYTIPNAQTNANGAYQVVVSNAFSEVVSAPANLTVFAGSITNDLTVHLTFDDTYADATGNGNDATNVGSPDFEPGFLGDAIHVDSSGSPANAPATNNYVTLGYPSDLNFGTDLDPGGAVDFSVSFWVKIFSQNDDKPFISNKDWTSGSNPGWGIFSQGDGMKWNYRDNAVLEPGVGSSRRDSHSVAPQLEDGGWHHVVVTFERHSQGKIYVDGVLQDVSPLAPDSTNVVGSVDTASIGWSINIGQDGTGTYTDGTGGAELNALIDDLAIWRRVITDREALGVFDAGLQGQTVDQSSVNTPGAGPRITLQPAGANVGLGASATLYVSALGTPLSPDDLGSSALAYQWYFGSMELAGATNSSFTITNMTPDQQGGYTVVITNDYGMVTSGVATVSYAGVLPPTINLQPVSLFLSPGAAATFDTAASAGGGAAVTYQWYKNGSPISGATNESLNLTNVQAADQGDYIMQATDSGGSTNSATAVLGIFSGPLNQGLVAWLPMDGDYRDYSGHANDGTAEGSPTFASGLVGQSLHFTTTNDDSILNYITLGYPSDLQFGTNSFSVGLWVNYTNHDDDPALIANKNWNSSGNVGWGIFSQGGGNFRVSAVGADGQKVDTSSTPNVSDGKWHLIVCTFWRGQNASIYMDTQPALTEAMPFNTSMDTVTNGLSVNIGQDGTGQYTDNHNSSLHIDGLIDEVMIWNRVITPQEVAALYAAGTNALTPLMSITNTTYSANSLTVNWKDGVPPFTVESNTNLAGTNWVLSTSTTNQYLTVPNAGSQTFIRVRGTP